MISINFEETLSSILPEIRLGCVQCAVHVHQSHNKIKGLSDSIIARIKSEITIEQVSMRSAIKSTKDAYRALGKDPSRYRPSAEALTRRIVNGKDLYQINNVIDLLNLISLQSGFSIGGYDLDKIVGEVAFGVGKQNEPYKAIGRGDLNIENLPVFRDKRGAFGSPTSDSLRTMVTEHTENFLMVILDFGPEESLESITDSSVQMYSEFADATNIEYEIATLKAK